MTKNTWLTQDFKEKLLARLSELLDKCDDWTIEDDLRDKGDKLEHTIIIETVWKKT